MFSVIRVWLFYYSTGADGGDNFINPRAGMNEAVPCRVIGFPIDFDFEGDQPWKLEPEYE